MLRQENVLPVLALVQPTAAAPNLGAVVEVLHANLETALADQTIGQLLQIFQQVAMALDFFASHALYIDGDLPMSVVQLAAGGAVRLCTFGLRLVQASASESAHQRGVQTFGQLLSTVQMRRSDAALHHALASVARRCKDADSAFKTMSDVVVQLSVAVGTWEITWPQLTFVKILGRGQFGEVQLAKLGRNQEPDVELVAVKTLLDEVSG